MSTKVKDKRQRGVSLIELMVTLLISSIVATTFFTTMIYQQRAYLRQLDNTEAQQNARATLDVMKSYIRQAGWGYSANMSLQGSIPIGACFDPETPASESRNCDNVLEDGGSDRIRISYALSDGFTDEDTSSDTGLSMTYSPGVPVPPEEIIAGLGLISGACFPVASGSWGADLVVFSDGPSPYNYALFDTIGSRGCSASNYADGFAFGPAEVADFYIDRSIARTPRLMLRLHNGETSNIYVVAYDIDDLQVRYAVDMDYSPAAADPSAVYGVDGADWCDDLRLPGGDAEDPCNTGFTDERQNYAMVRAVEVAVVARTREYKPNRDLEKQSGRSPVEIDVQNHRIVGHGDGYERWVYRAVVALRNNEFK